MSDLEAQIEARLAIAKAASIHGGEWTAKDDTADPEIGSWWVFNGKGNVTYEPFEATAQHIAANDPTTVTLMLEALREGERWRLARDELYTANRGEHLEWAADRCIDRQRDFDAALARLAEHWGQG